MLDKWIKQEQAHGGFRYRLYSKGKETPYFVDAAPHRAHYTCGCKYGLYGSGMGELIASAHTPYRIAACFGGFNTLKAAQTAALDMLKG